MAYEFRLPDIGEGVHEGEIVKWAAEPGAALERDQAVVEVMTDKATVELTTPVAGKLVSKNFDVGAIAPVGAVLFVVDDGKAEVTTNLPGHAAAAASMPAAAAKPAAPAKPAPAKPPAPSIAAKAPAAANPAAPVPAKPVAPAVATTKAAVAPAAKPASAPASAGSFVAVGSPGDGGLPTVPFGKVLAAPATRRFAREQGVDLTALEGTGPHGRVTREDVESAMASPAAQTAPAEAAPARSPESTEKAAPRRELVSAPAGEVAGDARVPFRGLRRKIAEAMARSKHTAAHFTVVEDVDVTDLVRLRKKAKQLGESYGIKVTYMPFLMKAAVIALRENPWLNATLDESTQEVVIRGTFNFGIAVDTPDGLIVPVVKHAETKGVLQLAKELGELAERTRMRRVSVDDLQGGTFTITNAGNIGGIFATPIINFPEVAILGVHRIRREAAVVVRDGKETIEPRSKMMISTSIDHRIVDGATGARFLVRMRELLEEPALLALA